MRQNNPCSGPPTTYSHLSHLRTSHNASLQAVTHSSSYFAEPKLDQAKANVMLSQYQQKFVVSNQVHQLVLEPQILEEGRTTSLAKNSSHQSSFDGVAERIRARTNQQTPVSNEITSSSACLTSCYEETPFQGEQDPSAFYT